MQPLLDADAVVTDPARADCAIFYSITHCQLGLRGVSFGNFLLKQVVEDLGHEFSRLRTFATLSPVPGFVSWLMTVADEPRLSGLRDVLAAVERGVLDEASLGPSVRGEVLSMCARYLLHAKKGRAPADPVARFHLSNGARLERLNWRGDTSEAGIRRSLGMTANYVYRLSEVEKNHEAYANHYRLIAGREIARLVARPAKPEHEVSASPRLREGPGSR